MTFFGSRLIAVCVVLLSCWGAVLPVSLHAAEPQELSCTCFCGQENQGVSPYGTMTTTECQAACQASKTTFVICAADATQYPVNFPRCFTKEACDRQEGIWDKDYQPLECEPNYRYCYPGPGDPAILSVPIGDTKTVADYGEYVAVAYNYLLSIAVIIAIVFVMVGGLQYVLAAGTGDVSKAKKRITNAVIGLVLLMLAYVILYTVNPQLIRLRVPSLPMIKRVELVGANSCEFLKGEYDTGYLAGKSYTKANGAPVDSPNVGKPYDINDSKKDAVVGALGPQACGSVSFVEADGEGNEVADGITCTYEACKNKGERCVGVGKDARCVKCQELTSTHSFGLTLSEDLCQSLSLPDIYTPPAGSIPPMLVQDFQCFYTHDPTLLIGGFEVGKLVAAPGLGTYNLMADHFGWSTENTELVAGGACALADIDCTKINRCEDYDNVQITTRVGTQILTSTTDGESPLFGNTTSLKSVCRANPCQALKPHLANCQVSDGSFSDSCITPPSSP